MNIKMSVINMLMRMEKMDKRIEIFELYKILKFLILKTHWMSLIADWMHTK